MNESDGFLLATKRVSTLPGQSRAFEKNSEGSPASNSEASSKWRWLEES